VAVGPETEDPGRAKAMTKLTVQGILSVVTVTGILALAGGLFVIKIPAESREFFIIVLTLLVAKVSDVFSYYFGSSQSSQVKNETIANLTAIVPIK
jgi:hypothetical protein